MIVPNSWVYRRKAVLLKKEGVKSGTTLSLAVVPKGFTIGTTAEKNEWGDPNFVQFSPRDQGSLETLQNLQQLFLVLRTRGIVLVSGVLAFQLPGGSLEMRSGADGSKHIRVWQPEIKDECVLHINHNNAPEVLVHALRNLYEGMRRDAEMLSS